MQELEERERKPFAEAEKAWIAWQKTRDAIIRTPTTCREILLRKNSVRNICMRVFAITFILLIVSFFGLLYDKKTQRIRGHSKLAAIF